MNLYEQDRYVTTVQNVRNTLNQYGVAIIPNVLNNQECEEMKSGMWDYLEHITTDFDTPINRNNPVSWKELKQLYPKHSMLLQQWGIGHAQFIWNLRQNQKLTNIFSNIWGVPANDLVVSFDGASFHMPPETTGNGWYKGKSWLHSDQCFLRNDLECIQSWVTAYDVNQGDATLAFLEGSHRLHRDFKDHFQITVKDDWFLLANEDQYNFYVNRGCEPHCIKCPKGSIVLWDSRTIHCGQEAMKERPVPNQRCVAYLCYLPRINVSQKNLQKKIKAFEELRTTNHWPNKPKLFALKPHTYGAPLPPIRNINPPIINALGRRLVGYED